MEKEKLFEFKNIGDSDGLPYTKVDITKVCRINKTFAMSFYQVDYQALANFVTGISSKKENEMKEIPILKIAMDEDAFISCVEQMNEILKKYRSGVSG